MYESDKSCSSYCDLLRPTILFSQTAIYIHSSPQSSYVHTNDIRHAWFVVDK